jgi:hypothetical protein
MTFLQIIELGQNGRRTYLADRLAHCRGSILGMHGYVLLNHTIRAGHSLGDGAKGAGSTAPLRGFLPEYRAKALFAKDLIRWDHLSLR